MFQLITLAFCSLVSVGVLASLSRYRARLSKLNAIPTVGHTGFFSSYISAYRFIKNGNAIVQEGYNRYPNSAFKCPLPDRWAVIISGPDMIDDLRKATDDQLSVTLAFDEVMHMGRVFGKSLIDDPYHIHVIQTTLTRSIGSKVPEVYDEIVAAFEDLLPPTADWVKVPTLHKVLNIVVRASNRLFVGLPLCRNEEWKALNIHLTTQVFKGALITNLAPKFIQPLVHWYFNPRSKAFATASKLLRPMIIDRLEKLDSNDEDWESPDDLLAWLIKATDGKRERLNPDDLIFRMLSLNMAAIHTTAFTHALFHLASRPALVKLLRNEMEEAISNEGWTKAAMGKTKMLDSFLKESQRMSSSSAVSVQRVPLRDFTFSNGLVVPAGTLILTSLRATHFDEAYYPNPTEFDAFRSFKKRETENESLKHQMVTPDVGYLAFGTGKHACPGRFFAVNELKLLVTHTLLHYDIRFDDGEEKPHQPVMFGGRVSLDAKTQVMFRKRVM